VSETALETRSRIGPPDPLREPWTDLARQHEAATLGMWLFLMSEMLFFGAVFMAFSFSRALNPHAFQAAARETAFWYGAANTLILVTSSLTITLAIRASAARARLLATALLSGTALLGVAFLAVKAFEYHDDLQRHLYPGAAFALAETGAAMFWSFYWITTGVHAIHLAVGVGLVARLGWLMGSRRLSFVSPQLEVTSLYWHLVDAFWVVLFPVLYVAGQA
jgi:cytochrome c oxidase subunit III